jgi:hypothetical protein
MDVDQPMDAGSLSDWETDSVSGDYEGCLRLARGFSSLCYSTLLKTSTTCSLEARDKRVWC